MGESRMAQKRTNFDFYSRPDIGPAPVGIVRPFWSVMIPTFNRLDYLGEAIRSVLDQDPGPEQMHIEVIDNYSTMSDVRGFVRDLAGGRVSIFRQSENVGMTRNWNTCLIRSIGHYVHILHDDDMVMPGFYMAYRELAESNATAAIITGPVVTIDNTGRATGLIGALADRRGPIREFLEAQSLSNNVQPPSTVFRRSAVERAGGYCNDLRFAPDWEYYSRLAGEGSVITDVVPHAFYRVHSGSVGLETAKQWLHVHESIGIIDHLCAKLPPEKQAKLPRFRYRVAADACTIYARRFAERGDRAMERRQLREALKLDPNWRRLKALLRAYLSRAKA